VVIGEQSLQEQRQDALALVSAFLLRDVAAAEPRDSCATSNSWPEIAYTCTAALVDLYGLPEAANFSLAGQAITASSARAQEGAEWQLVAELSGRRAAGNRTDAKIEWPGTRNDPRLPARRERLRIG
jgi:hypothetical protein